MQSDILAGLCVGIMIIPQGMSYAQNLAFLPQVYGLYGAFVPCLFYCLLGSSRHLAVGPVAVTSLLLGSGLTNMFGDFSINPSAPNDAFQAAVQHNYNKAAIQVGFIAGLIYTGIALLRLGWIVNYLSLPVISGFMTGAASIIMSSQVKYLTGQYYLPRADTVILNLKYLFDNMVLFRWPEFGCSVMFILILLFCQFGGQRLSKRYRWVSNVFLYPSYQFSSKLVHPCHVASHPLGSHTSHFNHLALQLGKVASCHGPHHRYCHFSYYGKCWQALCHRLQ